MPMLTPNVASTFHFFRRRAIPILLLVATLGGGLALVVLVASVVNSLLFHPLPYGGDPSRLVMVWSSTPTMPQLPLSYANFLDIQARATAFENLAVSQRRDMVVRGARDTERVEGILVSAGYFTALGEPPSVGRLIQSSDDRPESPRVAVISYGLWQRWFGADRSALGRRILVNSMPYTVIGVANSRLATLKAEIWIPFAPFVTPQMMDRGNFVVRVLGRLAPSRCQGAAQTELSQISSDLARQYPDTNNGVRAFIVRLDELIVQSVRKPVLLLFAGSIIILVVAWFHLSSVFLTLALERIREAGIRLALGATRRNPFRLFLTEVGAIAVSAWLLALVLGRAAIHSFVASAPNLVQRFDETNLDARVAAATLLFCLGAALLLALWLTRRVARIGISAVINESRANALAPHHRFQAGHVFLAIQITATAALAICAVYLFKEYRHIDAEGLTVSAGQTLTARVSLPSASYPKPEARIRFFERLIEDLRGVPGLDHISAVSRVPQSRDGRFKTIQLEGQPANSDAWNAADYFSAMPGYFQTVGLPILAGRDFTRADGPGSPEVVIIDQRFAARFWPNQNALGKKVRMGEGAGDHGSWLEVVGVVAPVRDEVGRNVLPFQAYFPYYQDPDAMITLVVRSSRLSQDVLVAIRDKLRSLDPAVPLYFVSTLKGVIDESLAAQRTATALLGLFALFALMLSVAGTYGIVSGSVISRERELFIRMALGASYWDNIALVLRETFVCVAIGVVVGSGLILFASKSLTHLWAGFGSIGWSDFGAGLVFVTLSAFIASIVAALFRTNVARRRMKSQCHLVFPDVDTFCRTPVLQLTSTSALWEVIESTRAGRGRPAQLWRAAPHRAVASEKTKWHWDEILPHIWPIDNRPQAASLQYILPLDFEPDFHLPSSTLPRSSTTSNQSMCRMVFAASATAARVASAKLTSEVPTISTIL